THMTASSPAVAAPAVRPLRLVSGGVAVVAAGVWLWIALWGLAAGALAGIWPGADAWLITSGSMSPALDAGDLVVTAPPEPGILYDFPTVITYEQEGRIVTHRIAEVVDGAYITKGDANRTDDMRPVQPEQVRGVGRVVVTWVGLPVHWWHTERQHLTVLSILSIMASVVIVRHGLPDHIGHRDQEPRSESRRRRRKRGKHRKVEETWMESNGAPLIWTAFLATAMSAVMVTASASFAAETVEGTTVRAGEWGTSGPVFEDDFLDCASSEATWVDGPLGGGFLCVGGSGFEKVGKSPNGGAWADFDPIDTFVASASMDSPGGNGDVDGFAIVDSDGFGYRVSIRHGNNARFRVDVLVDGARADGSGWVRLGRSLSGAFDVTLSYDGGTVTAVVDGESVALVHDASHMTGGFDHVWFTGKEGMVVTNVEVDTP
ncbi:MAG: signal peptidase I, partial [Acidimicrobiia bacterium]|nr:signal peptidase I [Acidimicrobiia bacterium]